MKESQITDPEDDNQIKGRLDKYEVADVRPDLPSKQYKPTVQEKKFFKVKKFKDLTDTECKKLKKRQLDGMGNTIKARVYKLDGDNLTGEDEEELERDDWKNKVINTLTGSTTDFNVIEP
jgi:hypothetical protein